MMGAGKLVGKLRSPRETVEGLVYFGRMIDKIRLEEAGKLPEEYRANLGKAFDQACCDFLGVAYGLLQERVRAGGTDEDFLSWCRQKGKARDLEERKQWSEYLSKRGWRDEMAARLLFRKKEAGWENRDEMQTFFDFIEADEGRAG